jgi:hypothetical protein
MACAVLKRNRRASESSSDKLKSLLEESGRFLALYALLARAVDLEAFATLAAFLLCLLMHVLPPGPVDRNSYVDDNSCLICD